MNIQIIFRGEARGKNVTVDTDSDIPVLNYMRDTVKYLLIPSSIGGWPTTVAHSSPVYLSRA